MRKFLFVFLCITSSSFSQISYTNIPTDSLVYISGPLQFSENHQDKLNDIIGLLKERIHSDTLSKSTLTKVYRVLYLKEYYNGNFKQAILYANSSKEASLVSKNYHFLCLSHIIKAQSYFELGKYEQSLQQHLKSLEVADKSNILNLKIACVGNLGNFKLLCGDNEGAIEILENTITEIEVDKNLWLRGFYPEMYSDLTLAYLNNNKLQKAKEANTIAINSSKKYKYYLGNNLLNKALIETENKNYDQALQTIVKADSIADRNHHKFKFDALKHLAKGKVYFMKGDYKIALSEFLQLEKLQEKNKINHLSFQEGLSYIAKIYTKLGKKSLALEYYNKALATFTESEQQKVKLISEITDKYDENQINKILKNQNLSNTAFIHQKYATIEKEIQKLHQEKTEKNYYLLASICFFAIIIGAFAFVIHKKGKRNKQKLEILLSKMNQKEEVAAKVSAKKKDKNLQLKDSEVQRILSSLNQLEKEEFYLEDECTATNVAKKLATNTTYLSKIINSYYQKSFSRYISDLRIHYTLQRLKSDKFFRRYSIQSIANEVGFKSRESFNNAFKKETGILPSFYIKELQKSVNG